MRTRTMTDEDLRWIREAYAVALLSQDESTQNGAVIVDQFGEPLSEGCNNIPFASRKTGRLQRPDKYGWTEHAEREAIYRAARVGRPLDGATLYCCWAACIDCARAVVLSGIRRMVRHSIPQHADRADWIDSIALADLLLDESGVEIVTVTGLIGTKVRFNEQMVMV